MVVARVTLVVAHVENVAMAAVPIVEVGTKLQPVGIEATILLVQSANRIGSREKPARAGRHQAVILRDVARLALSAARFARAYRADVFHARDGLAVAERVDRG